jgi:hypothetical protein
MSLKPSRYVEGLTLMYCYDGPPCDRGGIVTINKEQKYPGYICGSYNDDPTLEVAGVLLVDIVDLDNVNRTYFSLDDAGIGSKVQLLTKGTIFTNKVIGNPEPGQIAVLYPKGYIGGWFWGKIPKRVKVVGQFLDRVDGDGYVKVHINTRGY